MNEFGQRSVVSLLRASGNSGNCGGQVSLADFLNRRSAAAAAATRKRRVDEDGAQLESPTSASFDRACDSLTTHRLSKNRKMNDQGDRHRKVALQRQRQGNNCGGRHLLVLGDAPMHHARTHKSTLYQSQSYNHYADGCGWWGDGMVGMEEAGTACEWEGVASMSLGTSAAASP